MLSKVDLLKIFCVAAESPSFKDAANKLGISPQGVTRCIKQLESTLGELLFLRSTRSVKITQFGEEYLIRAQEVLKKIDDVFDKKLVGAFNKVKITAPSSIGKLFLLPILEKIKIAHPDIIFDVRLSNHISNVIDEQIDIGIRAGHINDNRFIARSIGQIEFMIVATPNIIAQYGKPETIDELDQFPLIALIDQNTGRSWPWYFNDNKVFTPTAPAFVTDDPEIEYRSALSGFGIAQVASYFSKPHIQQRTLVPLLENYAPEPINIYLYRPQRGPVPPRVRVVYDMITASFNDIYTQSESGDK